jgi:hypothetical protein
MSKLHKGSQPRDQLEKFIEEIRRLMLKSVKEVVSRENLSRGRPTRVAGMQEKQQRKGAEG